MTARVNKSRIELELLKQMRMELLIRRAEVLGNVASLNQQIDYLEGRIATLDDKGETPGGEIK